MRQRAAALWVPWVERAAKRRSKKGSLSCNFRLNSRGTQGKTSHSRECATVLFSIGTPSPAPSLRLYYSKEPSTTSLPYPTADCACLSLSLLSSSGSINLNHSLPFFAHPSLFCNPLSRIRSSLSLFVCRGSSSPIEVPAHCSTHRQYLHIAIGLSSSSSHSPTISSSSSSFLVFRLLLLFFGPLAEKHLVGLHPIPPHRWLITSSTGCVHLFLLRLNLFQTECNVIIIKYASRSSLGPSRTMQAVQRTLCWRNAQQACQ
jgi:hypothetical protein